METVTVHKGSVHVYENILDSDTFDTEVTECKVSLDLSDHSDGTVVDMMITVKDVFVKYDKINLDNDNVDKCQGYIVDGRDGWRIWVESNQGSETVEGNSIRFHSQIVDVTVDKKNKMVTVYYG